MIHHVEHAGIKQPGRPQLLLQLRPDGKRWPIEKPFTPQDCRDILAEIDEFVLEKVSSGIFALEYKRAAQHALVPAVPDPTLDRSHKQVDFLHPLINGTLQDKLFTKEIFDKLHCYSPQIRGTILEAELVAEFEGNGIIGTRQEIGFHPDKDIALITGAGSQSGCEFYNEHFGEAWNVFRDILLDMNIVSAQPRKLTKPLIAEIYAKFHKATGGWVYRSHGSVRGNSILQRLSCNDLTRSVNPLDHTANFALLYRARLEFERETTVATEDTTVRRALVSAQKESHASKQQGFVSAQKESHALQGQMGSAISPTPGLCF